MLLLVDNYYYFCDDVCFFYSVSLAIRKLRN